MVSGLLTVVATVVVLATFGSVSALEEGDFQRLLEDSIKVPMTGDNFDTMDYQLEARVAREFEGNKTFDDEFMSMFIESLEAEGLATPDKTDMMAKLKAEDVSFTDDDYSQLSFNQVFPWANNMLNYQSCPRSQYYGCRSVKYGMPCMRLNVAGTKKTCCPVFPDNIVNNMAYCNCCKCSLLSEYGIQCGGCARRYKNERVLFACHESGSNWELVRHYVNYPHSCYCKAH